jgi:hypothetical protein
MTCRVLRAILAGSLQKKAPMNGAFTGFFGVVSFYSIG